LSLQINSLLDPLRQLIHNSSRLSHSLFTEIFSRVWPLLPPSSHRRIQKPLCALLARDILKRQLTFEGPNVVQTLMDSLARCQPALYIPIPLLKFVGKTYNCWHSVISLLEDRLKFDNKDDAVFDGTFVV
jgi:transformation/transcription domain-associated protein